MKICVSSFASTLDEAQICNAAFAMIQLCSLRLGSETTLHFGMRPYLKSCRATQQGYPLSKVSGTLWLFQHCVTRFVFITASMLAPLGPFGSVLTVLRMMCGSMHRCTWQELM